MGHGIGEGSNGAVTGHGRAATEQVRTVVGHGTGEDSERTGTVPGLGTGKDSGGTRDRRGQWDPGQ